MRRIISVFAALTVLFVACTPENKPADKEVVATAIKLNKNELTLYKGANETLTVTFTPENVTNKTLTWVSSDTKVVTVADGIVVAVDPGETEIIVKCGEATDRCQVTVIPAGSVDLGIVMTRTNGSTYRLYWAKANISEDGLCSKAEDYGDYYAWGEVETYYSSLNPLTWKTGKTAGYDSESYKWCIVGVDGELDKYTKYCPENMIDKWGGSGKPDNKLVLETGPDGDDVASRKLGGKWRMPTDAEWTELMEKCNWTWTTQNGVNGALVTAPNGNSIFLPAAGKVDGGFAGSRGNYWSSSLYTDGPNAAWRVYIKSDDKVCHRFVYQRPYDCSIRPVTE